MSVKVEVKVDADSYADCMIYNVYTSVAGIVSVVLGILNIGLTVAFIMRRNYLYTLIFAAFAILILCVFPYYIRRKVKRNMEGSKRVNEAVTYEFGENGITTTTTEDSGTASWSRFKKAVSRKYVLLLYADNKQVIILPIAQLGENYGPVVDMIYEHMPVPAVRVRRPGGKQAASASKKDKQ